MFQRLFTSRVIVGLGLAALMSDVALADIHVQPNEGATLSGRTIVFSPGHGIFKDGTTWRFQRGVLFDLREDIHTNEIFIEFVQRYLANAGARVESVRERSFQTEEHIIDNGGAGYSETGGWTSSTSAPSFYGTNYRYAPVVGNETARASFRPSIAKAGLYPVYVWFTKGTNRSATARFIVEHAGGATEIAVNQQSLGDHWTFLGHFYFNAGTNGAVHLSNQGSDTSKVVIADAVRFGGGVGVSGRARWEEAAVEFLAHKGFSSSAGDVTIRPYYANWLAGGDSSRWRSDFLYFALHTNAGGGGTATGVSTFSYSNGRTPSWGSAGPAQYPSNPSALQDASDALRNAVQAEVLRACRALHRTSWPDRGLHKMNFGELRECLIMPSSLVELGFHDSADDAELLSSARFRHTAGRAIYKGIIRYWAPNTPIIPLPPEALTITNLGQGSVRIGWRAVADPLEASAVATQYKVYLSRNGRGFDNGQLVNTNSLTLNQLADGTRLFVRVAALNAGGESLPSSLGGAVVGGLKDMLLVDGFDREYRHTVDNVNARYTRDYAVEHIDALAWARPLAGVDFACNEALIQGDLDLSGYKLVDWALGREGSIDRTFDSTEQQLTESYLNSGGRLLVTGTELGWDLQGANGGVRFLNEVLGVEYVGDDAGVMDIVAEPGSPLDGIGGFSLETGGAGRYKAESPDRLRPASADSELALRYTSREGAAITTNKGQWKVVVMGFPLESVTDSAARRSLTEQSLTYLLAPASTGGGGSVNPPVGGSGSSASSGGGSGSGGGGGGGGGGGCDLLGHCAASEGSDLSVLAPLAFLLLALLALRRS